MRRLLALALFASSLVAQAQGIIQLADINTTLSAQSDAIQVGNRWVMQMCSPCQTWGTDGTNAGTVPIGPKASSNAVLFNGAAYFLVTIYGADPSQSTIQLWRSDGTAAGTAIAISSIPAGAQALYVAGPYLYIYGGEPTLSRTDGVSTPVPLTALNAYFLVTDAMPLGNNLVFTHPTNAGQDFELWKSDGTAAGTVLITTTNTGAYQSVQPQPRVIGNQEFFWANDGFTGKLWTTDGTAAGTVKVTDAVTSQFHGGFVALQGVAYALADARLVRSDGTAAGTSVVRSFAGSANTNPTPVVAGNAMYWTGVDDGGTNPVLWRSDGTAAGTTPIALPWGATAPTQLVAFNGTLYVDSGATAHVYRVEGTGPFTLVDTGIVGQPYSSLSDQFLVTQRVGPASPTGGNLSLSASFGDGTAANTHVVHTAPGVPNSGSECGMPFSFGTLALFGANDGTGCSLWRTDGTPSGTWLLKQSGYGLVSVVSGVAYFFQADGLWRTDGTVAGTTRVKALPAPTDSRPRDYLTALGGLGYFVVNSELWRTDGTDAGTFDLGITLWPDDYAHATSHMDEGSWGTFGGHVYFTYSAAYACNDPRIGPTTCFTEELWTTDGTIAGTTKVISLPSARIKQVLYTSDRLYFVDYGSSTTPGAVYVTDGTSAGTRLLASLPSPGQLVGTPNQLFIWSTAASGAITLYRMDYAGTNLQPLTTFASSALMVPNAGTFRDTLFFARLEDNGSAEYTWATNGATAPVRIAPGEGYGTAASDAFYFRSTTGALYRTDGTPAGTGTLGPPLSVPADMRSVGSSVFFLASDGTGRRGLWRAAANTLEFLGAARAGYLSRLAVTPTGVMLFAGPSDDMQEPGFYAFSANPMSFPSVGPVQPGVTVTSAPALVAGLVTSPVPANASNGQLCVSSGNSCSCDVAPFAATNSVSNGQYVCLRNTSSSTLGGQSTTTLAIGSTTATFTTTTVPAQRLTVSTTGSGKVYSTTPGIDCGVDCTEVVPQGTTMTLVPAQSLGWSFRGWTGGCNYWVVACVVTMNADASVTATFGPSIRRGLAGDFNGDGLADMLFRNASGNSSATLMHASGLHDDLALTAPATGAVVFDKGDFDGDGKADLLWRTPDGAYWLTLQDGATTTASLKLLDGGFGWEVVAKGDFNGDGKMDLLWRGPAGDHRVALMNGATNPAYAQVVAAGAGLTVALVADFDGDAKADIVWTGADGSATMFLMNGGTVATQQQLLGGGTGWTPVAFGDLDGDGDADLIWRHADGRHGLWLMHGTTAWGYSSLIGANTGWNVKRVRDYDGDGRSDLLWVHDDGSVAVWLMYGSSPVGYQTLLQGGSGWTVVASEDYDGDGRDDLLWRGPNGEYAVWLMDGVHVKTYRSLFGAGSGWEALPAQ